MNDLKQRLDQEQQRQGYAWGHILKDRWTAVETFSGNTVLDVGCSNGVYVKRLHEQGKRAFGVDLIEMPQWQILKNAFSVADACVLPFAENSYDTIISFETLEHIPQPQRALQEYHRVCKSNIILSVPNCQTPDALKTSGLTFHHWIDQTHTNFFTLESFVEEVKRSGFKIVEAKSINPVSPAIAVLTSLGVPLSLARILGAGIRKISPQKYHMSLLIVATKV